MIFAKGYGLADVEKHKPVDAERTMFRPGSISKLFTWTAVMQQVKTLQAQSAGASSTLVNGQVRDLRSLLWSSIDNDTSRDLDQAEVAERVAGGIRVMIAVADVDSDVPMGSPADQHAASETT